WLRSRLKRRRARHQIQLAETSGACAGRSAFAAETDEDRLRAGGGDPRWAGVREAGDAADGNCSAGPLDRIEEINILCAEISDDELRAVGRQGQTAQTGVGRRSAGRLDGGEK